MVGAGGCENGQVEDREAALAENERQRPGDTYSRTQWKQGGQNYWF